MGFQVPSQYEAQYRSSSVVMPCFQEISPDCCRIVVRGIKSRVTNDPLSRKVLFRMKGKAGRAKTDPGFVDRFWFRNGANSAFVTMGQSC
jgi:hypothetical protein